MPKRTMNLSTENIFHIYNRGVNKDRIFFSDKNYHFFLYKCNRYFSSYAICYAYCLMPNHFHLLIRIENDLFVDKALQPLMVSYSKAINTEVGRVGPLFQGRFQSTLIEDNIQFLDCFKYIQLNPVKAGLVNSPVEWEYSSYRDYLNHQSTTFINTSEILFNFNNIEDFREYIEFGCQDYQSRFWSVD